MGSPATTAVSVVLQCSVIAPEPVSTKTPAAMFSTLVPAIPATVIWPLVHLLVMALTVTMVGTATLDRKSTRLNSSHLGISYAVFCLKKKKERYAGLEPPVRARFAGLRRCRAACRLYKWKRSRPRTPQSFYQRARETRRQRRAGASWC